MEDIIYFVEILESKSKEGQPCFLFLSGKSYRTIPQEVLIDKAELRVSKNGKLYATKNGKYVKDFGRHRCEHAEQILALMVQTVALLTNQDIDAITDDAINFELRNFVNHYTFFDRHVRFKC